MVRIIWTAPLLTAERPTIVGAIRQGHLHLVDQDQPRAICGVSTRDLRPGPILQAGMDAVEICNRCLRRAVEADLVDVRFSKAKTT